MADDTHAPSQRGAAEIARRKAAARPRQLAEMIKAIQSRGGIATTDQLYVVGCVLSYIVPASEWRATFRDALVTNGQMPPAEVDGWLMSAAARTIDEHIQAAERGEVKVFRQGKRGRQVDPRQDYSTAGIVDVFGLTDADADAMELEILVSDRRRKEIERRAVGIQSKAEVQARPKVPPPWEQAGVSRATWHRQQAKAKRHAEAMMIINGSSDVRHSATVSMASTNTGMGCPGGEAEGSSYKCDTVADGLTNSQSKSVSPTQPGQPVDPQAVPGLRNRPVEVQRHAVLAAGLGCVWARWPSADWPGSWFEPSADRPLSADDEARFWASAGAANDAVERAEAVATAQHRRWWAGISREERAARLQAEREEYRCRQERRQAPPDGSGGDGRPARVSPHVWLLVPPTCRERVIKFAGRIFLRTGRADEAVLSVLADVVEAAQYDEEVIAAALAAVPAAGEARIRRWRYADQIGGGDDAMRLWEKIGRQRDILAQARAAVAAAGIPDTEAAAVTDRAARLISGGVTDLAQAVRDAQTDYHRDRRASQWGSSTGED